MHAVSLCSSLSLSLPRSLHLWLSGREARLHDFEALVRVLALDRTACDSLDVPEDARVVCKRAHCSGCAARRNVSLQLSCAPGFVKTSYTLQRSVQLCPEAVYVPHLPGLTCGEGSYTLRLP